MLAKNTLISLLKHHFLHHFYHHSMAEHGGAREQEIFQHTYILILKGVCFQEFSGNAIFGSFLKSDFQYSSISLDLQFTRKPKMALKSYKVVVKPPQKCQKSTLRLILMVIDPLLAHLGQKMTFEQNLAY